MIFYPVSCFSSREKAHDTISVGIDLFRFRVHLWVEVESTTSNIGSENLADPRTVGLT
jgi:hypothetical protein